MLNPEIHVSCKKLSKAFGSREAVHDVDLEIYRGECFGLLGANGAGKSTLLRMLYAHTEVTQGDLYVLGLSVKKNSREIKSRIGVIPQDNQLDIDFNVYENLMLFAKYHNIPQAKAETKIKELISKFRLEEYQYQSPENLSGGWQRRVAIARALLNEPELLIFDEPTTGLDPQMRRWLWQEIRALKKMGITMILSTHFMQEAQELCDRIAIMSLGKIISLDSPKNLIKENFGPELVEFEVNPEELNYYSNRLREKSYKYQVFHNRVLVSLDENQNSKALLEIISSDQIEIRKPSLDDVYLKLCGASLTDE